MSSTRKIAFATALIAVLVVGFVAYWPGLTGPLLLDDLPQLGSLIDRSGNDPALLFNNYLMSTSGPLGRPVSMMTFIVDAIAHGPDIWWWKYSSVLYHLICGLTLCWLMAFIVRAAAAETDIDPWLAGIAVAGLWILHPLNVSTVLYTVQRMTILSTLFVFAGMLSYIKGRFMLNDGKRTGWMAIAAAYVIFLPLAAFSKESGVLLPVYILLLEFFILQFAGTEKTTKAVRLLQGAVLACCVAAAVALIANLDYVLEGYAFRDYTLVERVLSQFRILVIYLTQLLMPLPIRMGFFHDDFVFSTGLFIPVTTFFSLILVLTMFLGAFVVRNKSSLLAFGVFFFFASHALESTVFGLELMFEHRNYAGSAGIMLAVVAIIYRLFPTPRSHAVAISLILICFSFLTWQRTTIWSSSGNFYQHAYTVHPTSSRVNLTLANANAAAGQFEFARSALTQIDSRLARDLHALYFDCIEKAAVDRDDLLALTRLRSDVIDAHVTSSAGLLIGASGSGRCTVPVDAMLIVLDQLLEGRVRSTSDRVSLYLAKANLLQSMNSVDEAVTTYRQAQEMSDVSAAPLYLAADALAKVGRPEEARSILQQAAAAERETRLERPDLAETVYAGIATYYINRGEIGSAFETYEEAVLSMPESMRFYVSAAELALRQNRYEDAADWLARIEEVDTATSLEFDYRIERISRKLEGKTD